MTKAINCNYSKKRSRSCFVIPTTEESHKKQIRCDFSFLDMTKAINCNYAKNRRSCFVIPTTEESHKKHLRWDFSFFNMTKAINCNYSKKTEEAVLSFRQRRNLKKNT